MEHELILRAIEAKGVASSDIKSYEAIWNWDAYNVLLWNRRKFIVTGLEIYAQRVHMRRMPVRGRGRDG